MSQMVSQNGGKRDNLHLFNLSQAGGDRPKLRTARETFFQPLQVIQGKFGRYHIIDEGPIQVRKKFKSYIRRSIIRLNTINNGGKLSSVVVKDRNYSTP